VILAGGLGTRLWPITNEIPKPMVPVAGAPFLEHQLRLLRQQGITDIVLLTGHLGERIRDYFGDGAEFGLSIRYSRETTPMGTGGALREAADRLADRFLLLYGDSLLPIDYVDLLNVHRDTRTEGLVAVCDNRLADTDVINNIALDEHGFVVRYEKDKPGDSQLTHVEAGVLALSRSVLSLIPPGFVSLEHELYPKLIAQHQLAAYRTHQRFYDIGTPARLRVVEAFLSHDYHADPFSN
jgi:NDP-sugar pyrophosphorylase family protein